jgi:HK97 family phage major capsid protein
MTKPLTREQLPGYRAALNAERMRSLCRSIHALGHSRFVDRTSSALEFAKRAWPNDPDVPRLLRAAVAPDATTGSASALAAQEQALLVALSPVSAIGGLSAATPEMPLSWDEGTAVIQVPSINMQNVSGFVGEAAPMPVIEGGSNTVSLKPHKYGCITVLTSELFRYSRAPELIERSLLEAVGASLDAILFSASAATPTTPAGLLLNIPALTPIVLTQANRIEAFYEDLSTLAAAVSGVAGNASVVFVCSPKQAAFAKLRLMDDADADFLILASSALPAGTVVCIATAAFCIAAGSIGFDLSTQSVLHFDTAPAQIGTPGTPPTVAATSMGLFQSDLVGIKFRMFVDWKLRAASGLAWTSAVNW